MRKTVYVVAFLMTIGCRFEPNARRPAETIADRVLAFSAESLGHGNSYVYYKISDARHTIAPGDVLEYDQYIDPASPEINGAIDIQFVGGGNLRDSGATDEHGRNAHASTILKSAAGQWIHRRISLDRSAGRITERWDVAAEGDAAGTYVQYFDNVVVTRDGEAVLEIFRDGVSAGRLDWSAGYDADSIACVTAPARASYPRGFIPGDPETIDKAWGLIALGKAFDARAASPHGAELDFDGHGRSYPVEEFPAGVVYVGRTPFRFASGRAGECVRASGQRLDVGPTGGGRYYELHLAVAAVAAEAVDASWEIEGADGRTRSLSIRIPPWQGEDARLRVRFTHLHGSDEPARPGLAIVRLPIAAAFPIEALRLPDDNRICLFAATIHRRDDAPEDTAFRRDWLAREAAGPKIERYLRNVRYGPWFTDLSGEEVHEKRLFELFLARKQDAFDHLLDERLADFESRGAELKKGKVYFVGESHIDLEWLWPWRETVQVCHDTFAQVLRFMEAYPDFRFSQGSAQTYQWMKDRYPDLFGAIRARVKSGQWELVGGTWTEPDFNMPAGESLARQILRGRRFFDREFGKDVRIGWAPDSFGYTHQLPQLLRSAGIYAFFTTKMLWNDTTEFPYHLCRWLAPDGSVVVGCTPPQGIGSRVRPDRLKDMLDAMEERHGLRSVIVPFGVGDHGGGPSREDIETILDLGRTDLAPTVKMSTAVDYIHDILKKGDAGLPMLDDELYLQYHRGTYTSQGRIKWFNRNGEVLLLSAERFATLAHADGAEWPGADFDEMWRRVLFHQCHDGLPGTSVPVVKEDIRKDYDWILSTGRARLNDALETLARSIDTSGPGRPIVVFNPLAWDRIAPVMLPETDAIVLDADRHPVPSQRTDDGRLVFMADVPSLGYAVYHLVPRSERPEAAPALRIQDWTFANDRLEFSLNPETGHLTSVRTLPNGDDVLAGDGNLLEFFDDRPKQWDAWNLGLSNRSVITALDGLEIVERGPVRVVVRLKRSFSKSQVSQDIVLYAGRPWIEFRTNVDWHEDHKFLRAAFPLARWSAKATYHVPFGTMARPADPHTDAEKAMFEVPALFWADQGDDTAGAALLNDCKYGYSAHQQWLRLSLLKAATWPDPKQDQGHHTFAYAFYPHAGDWRQAGVMHTGYEFNYPLYVYQPAPTEIAAGDGRHNEDSSLRQPRHAFIRVLLRDANGEYDGPDTGVVLTALKPAEDGDGWILRLHELFGRPAIVSLRFDREFADAERVDILERSAGPVKHGGRRLDFRIGPHRIEGLRLRPSKPPSQPGS
ncbi:MAG: alpha-mannosidase [Phycisphaerae bacterium]